MKVITFASIKNSQKFGKVIVGMSDLDDFFDKKYVTRTQLNRRKTYFSSKHLTISQDWKNWFEKL